MIVVDTSVWIEFFQGTGSSFDQHLAELIRADAPIALTEVIYCEMLQGIRDDSVHARVREILQAFPVLLLDGLRSADRAVALYRACRRRGLEAEVGSSLDITVFVRVGSFHGSPAPAGISWRSLSCHRARQRPAGDEA